MSILGSVLEIIVGIFKRRQSPQYAKAQRRKMRAQIEREVRSGDEEAVNARLKKTLKAIFLPATLAFTLSGCAARSEVVYVNEPDRIRRMELDGVVGWWVPDGVYTRMQDQIQHCTCQ